MNELLILSLLSLPLLLLFLLLFFVENTLNILENCVFNDAINGGSISSNTDKI